MQNTSKKESDQSSVHSSAACIVSCHSRWNSNGSQVLQPSLSKDLSLNMDSPHQHCYGVKQFGLHLQDHDSSSTQSTGQSHHEVVAMGGGNVNGQCVSAQSGCDETCGRHVECHMQSIVPQGAPDIAFPLSQVASSQSMVRIQYPYVDPYFGTFLSYGSQASINPQVMGMAPARVPLPLNLAEDDPIYVNAKQYRAILRRRQSRAKLEARNKLVKDRKPYLHESRHLHALKRARGSGGRFLDTKNLQQYKPTTTTTDGQNALDSALLQKGGNILESEVVQSENGNAAASCSDVTSVSNSENMFPQVSGYPHMQGGGGHMYNGSQ